MGGIRKQRDPKKHEEGEKKKTALESGGNASVTFVEVIPPTPKSFSISCAVPAEGVKTSFKFLTCEY